MSLSTRENLLIDMAFVLVFGAGAGHTLFIVILLVWSYSYHP